MPEIYDRLYRLGRNSDHHDGDAGLWTDGRYLCRRQQSFPAAGEALSLRSGGVPTTLEFLKNICGTGVLGFDGRVVDTAEGEHRESTVWEKVRISAEEI